MNKTQARAIELLRSRIQQRMSKDERETYGKAITEWNVRDDELFPGSKKHFVAVSAKVEMTALPDGNLLKAIDRETWLAFIGERGKIELHMGPSSLCGIKDYLGMHVCYTK